MHLSRREFVKGGTAGTLLLAGCLDMPGDQESPDDASGSGDADTPGDESGGEGTELRKIEIPAIQGATLGPISVAQHLGLYEENGVDPSVREFTSPGDLETNFQTESVPWKVNSPAFSYVRAYNEGKDVRIVNFSQLNHMKFVVPANIDNVQNLEGEKIAVTSRASAAYVLVTLVLEYRYDIDIESYFDVREMPPPMILSNLQSGEVQAGTLFPPYLSTLLVGNDEHKVGIEMGEVYEEESGHVWTMGQTAAYQSFLNENREAIEGVVRSHRGAASAIRGDPDLLIESGFTDTFDATDEQAQNMAEELQGIYLSDFDHEEYKEALLYQMEEGARLGVINEVPDEGIFELMD